MKLTYVILLFFCIAAGFPVGVKSTNDYSEARRNNNAVSTDRRPNIILIMADDMGRECLSSYGSASYQTPNLDRLAEDGVRFENMFSQPLCTPSRVKIMTGKLNFRNYTDFGYLDPKERTFGNLLKDAGYTTVIAGKWQLNGIYGDKKPGWDNVNRPYHFGFDQYCLWQLTKRGNRYADPMIKENGHQLLLKKDAYGPDIFCDFVLNFIEREKGKKRPFFIYYPMVLVHYPFVPTPDSPEWKDTSNRYQSKERYFKNMVAYADKIVGKVMKKLKETGLEQNTLVIFLGDNGTNDRITSNMKDGQVIKGDKGYLTDWGTRVPLIAYWKGKSLKGNVNTDLLDFSDVLPTLEAAAGIHNPVTKIVDGRSFLPQIIGRPVYSKPYIYMYYKPDWGKWKKALGVFARDKRYKLYDDGRFYDLKEDVLEQHNIPSKRLDKRVLRIRERLQNILDQEPVIDKNGGSSLL